MALRVPGIMSTFEAETRVRQTALAMSVYFLQERKTLPEFPQHSFLYRSSYRSGLLSHGHLELQGRLSMHLAFKPVLQMQAREKETGSRFGLLSPSVCHFPLLFDQYYNLMSRMMVFTFRLRKVRSREVGWFAKVVAGQ